MYTSRTNYEWKVPGSAVDFLQGWVWTVSTEDRVVWGVLRAGLLRVGGCSPDGFICCIPELEGFATATTLQLTEYITDTYNTFTFSRRFYPKQLTNEDNGSNQNQQKSSDMQVLWQVSVSLTQYM